ncbi:MAG TPA: hypothetical protein VGB85_11385, partial [Nannocystis sp.]
ARHRVISDPTDPRDPMPMASDSLIALIQPFLDDELPASERARVEAVLAQDPVLRDMVDEQRSVRQALRDLPPEAAPQALQARVLLELDAVDREQAADPAPGWRDRFGGRLRSFFRGAAVMVPAGATALALFLVTRTGAERHVPEASPASAPVTAAAPTLLDPSRSGLVLGAAPGASPGVRLVGAALPTGDRPPSSVIVERQVGPRRVLDRHEPAGGPPPSEPHAYRGRSYWLGHVGGQPAVAFESDGVRHTLTADTRESAGFRQDREYAFLLSLGDALQEAER